MPPDDDEALRKSREKLSKDLAIATTGAIAGSVVGGPVGALVGGALPPVANFLLEINARRVAKAESLLLASAAISKLGIEEFIENLRASEHLSELAARILQASITAGSIHQLHAYAALLSQAEATSGSVSFVKYLPMVGILEAMQEPHFDVLLYICRAHSEKKDVVTPDDIIGQFPGYVPFLRSIVRTLELHGLILDETRLVKHSEPSIKWVPSELGLALADIIAAGVPRKE